MADKSWMKPGAKCWVYVGVAGEEPYEVTLSERVKGGWAVQCGNVRYTLKVRYLRA